MGSGLTKVGLALAFFAVGSLHPQGRHSVSHAIAIGPYVHAIHQIRIRLDTLSTERATGPRVQEVQARLRSLARVRMPDGRVLQTGDAALAAQLQGADHKSIRRVALGIDQLDDALSAAPRRSVSVSNLRQLDSVLADPVFHPEQSWQQRLEQWLGDLLLRLIQLVPRDAGVSPLLALILSVLFLSLVGGVAVLVARGALRRTVDETAPVKDSAEPSSSPAAMEQANWHAASGDYRLALRYLFLAVMLDLQSQRLVELRPGLTNREHLRAIREDPRHSEELQLALREMVEEFDRVWYGHGRFSANNFARAQTLADRIHLAAVDRAAA